MHPALGSIPSTEDKKGISGRTNCYLHKCPIDITADQGGMPLTMPPFSEGAVYQGLNHSW